MICKNLPPSLKFRKERFCAKLAFLVGAFLFQPVLASQGNLWAAPKEESAALPEGYESKNPFKGLGKDYAMKARAAEKKGHTELALRWWKIARELEPKNETYMKREKRIASRFLRTSEGHFRKGVEGLKQNNPGQGYREFLKALAYNPANEKAFNMVKHKLNSKEFVTYEVQKGDTLKAISQREYGGENFESLLAYFNNLPKRHKPKRGDSLKLPVLVSVLSHSSPSKNSVAVTAPPAAEVAREAVAESQPVEEEAGADFGLGVELSAARGLFQQKDYVQAVAAILAVLADKPDNEEAQKMLKKSYYEVGRKFEDSEPLEAQENYRQLPVDYLDTKERLAQVSKNITEKSEFFYREGVQHFVNSELDNAIVKFEESLRYNPENPRAKRDLDKALSVKEKLQAIE